MALQLIGTLGTLCMNLVALRHATLWPASEYVCVTRERGEARAFPSVPCGDWRILNDQVLFTRQGHMLWPE